MLEDFRSEPSDDAKRKSARLGSESPSPEATNDGNVASALLPPPKDRGHYMQLLLRDFHALEKLIREDRLEKGVKRIGGELELNLLQQNNRDPAFVGDEIHAELDDDAFTTEFARFNLEVNSSPLALEAGCFAQFQQEMQDAVDKVQKAAQRCDCDTLLTGIIPTLNKSHISPDALTPNPRYQKLYEIRRALKGESYEYRIQGVDELLTRDNIALFAGCVTSFQTHLQIDADDFVDHHNWAQLLAAPLLACATYSPLFLGKRLWHETRVALFEQAADTRNPESQNARHRPRVFFGDAWLEGSVLELFQEDIAGFEPLFTVEDCEDPGEAIAHGRAPKLEAWNAFNGSIYRWNRVCYGQLKGRPALRIENRILPSGPTVEDMVANAAFWTGAMLGLPRRYRDLPKSIAFEKVKENFFTAARLGLDVRFNWLDGKSVSARELILDELLPIARQGLASANVDQGEAQRYLGIIEQRVSSGQTGSRWMIDSYTNLLRQGKRDEALAAITSGMIQRQQSGEPVHTWSPVELQDAGDWKHRYDTVHKLMTTDLYKVNVDDVVDLVAHIMEWRHIGHIPVEDKSGRLVGIINKNSIINYTINNPNPSEPAQVGDIMVRDPLTVELHTPLKEAVRLILENEISCLPVLSEGNIVGIVTERDFVQITKGLISELESTREK